MNYKLKSAIFGTALTMAFVLLMSTFMAAQDVKTNYMPGTDFTKYHTYKWVTIEGVRYPDQIVDQQIRMAIDTQMTAKGFIKTETDTADLDVAYQAAVTEQKEWNAYGMGGGWRMGGGMATATSTTIQTGTLAVDFYDPARKELLWRGTATKTLNPSSNPEKNQKNLNNAVEKLLKNFPPKPKK
ncbi:MAG: DUF4136 domain-containing protein [Terriglobales bacterium]